MKLYFYADGDQQRGPVPADALASLGVRPDTLVWSEGMAEWTRADEVVELAGQFTTVATPTPPGPADVAVETTPPFPPAEEPPPVPQAPLMLATAAPGGTRELAYHSAYGPGAPSNGQAMASMILGILAAVSLLGCMWYLSIPCGILAIIFGYQAKARIARGEATGRGFALTGIITGIASLALLALSIIIVLAILGIAAVSS